MPKPQNAKHPITQPDAELSEPVAGRGGKSSDLFELRPGLFLNPVQFISVRTVPMGDERNFAVLALSNGEKLDLTREEFAALTDGGTERPAVAMSQKIRGAVQQGRSGKKATKTKK